MKLALVYPEIECSVTRTSTYSLPLGLGSIATFCKKKLGVLLNVKILDGSLMNHKEQLKEIEKFKPNIIGIAPTIASQKNAYEIGTLAKKFNALVIFGGVNSTNLWKNMLTNRDFIDCIVLYDGEIPFYLILNRIKEYKIIGKKCFEGIPNLIYKDKEGKIHEPSSIYIPNLEDLPDIDYSLFNLNRFFEQTQKKGFGKAITYYAGKGCSKRGGINLKKFYSSKEYNSLVCSMDVCTFCGRNELGLRNIKEDREARILKNLHQKHGVRGFFNVQDTVNLKNSTPIGLKNCWFRLFIGTESITTENIQRLKQRYGSKLIFQVGIEATSPKIRNVYGKTSTDIYDLISKIKLMKKEGIELHASFILGGRGETRESLKKTTEFTKILADYENVTWILMSPQLILPGSPDYKSFLQLPRMSRKYANQDLIDIKEINQDFLSQFTPDLTRQEILTEIKQTFEEIRKKGRKDLILDIKGVVKDEEEYVSPSRPYLIN